MTSEILEHTYTDFEDKAILAKELDKDLKILARNYCINLLLKITSLVHSKILIYQRGDSEETSITTASKTSPYSGHITIRNGSVYRESKDLTHVLIHEICHSVMERIFGIGSYPYSSTDSKNKKIFIKITSDIIKDHKLEKAKLDSLTVNLLKLEESVITQYIEMKYGMLLALKPSSSDLYLLIEDAIRNLTDLITDGLRICCDKPESDESEIIKSDPLDSISIIIISYIIGDKDDISPKTIKFSRDIKPAIMEFGLLHHAEDEDDLVAEAIACFLGELAGNLLNPGSRKNISYDYNLIFNKPLIDYVTTIIEPIAGKYLNVLESLSEIIKNPSLLKKIMSYFWNPETDALPYIGVEIVDFLPSMEESTHEAIVIGSTGGE